MGRCYRIGARLAFADCREMLAHPDIDAVSVVLRVPAHHVHTIAALDALSESSRTGMRQRVGGSAEASANIRLNHADADQAGSARPYG